MENKYLYEIIMTDIKESIKRGIYVAEDTIPSELEIEKKYNVSNITVRRALNELENDGIIYRIKGKGSFVKKQIIKPAVKASKQSQIHNVISLIMPFDSTEGGGVNLIRGVSEYLNSNDFIFNFVNSHDDYEEEKALLVKLSKISNGIILYPKTGVLNMDVIYSIASNGYPLVTIDRRYPYDNVSSVVADNKGGAQSAVEHLILNGHKEIGFLSDAPIEYASSIRDRFLGYCAALRKNKIEVSIDNYIINFLRFIDNVNPKLNYIFSKPKLDENENTDLYKCILDYFLNRQNPVTGILALSDNEAKDLITVGLKLGIAIPDKLSVIGFDNLDMSQYLDVPLTTIAQDFYTIGMKASEKVAGLVLSNDISPENIIVPTNLVERKSVFDMRKSNPKPLSAINMIASIVN